MKLPGFVTNVFKKATPMDEATKGAMSDLKARQEQAQRERETVDPDVQRLADMKLKGAQAFSQNLPALSQSRFDTQADPARRAIAEQMAGVRRGAASRGLLYSGLARGAEAATAQKGASDLSSMRQAINQQGEQESEALQDSALEAGQRVQQQSQEIQDRAYNRALQQRVQQQQQSKGMFGSLLGL